MSLSSHPKRLVNKKILHTVILFYNSRITAIAHRASVTQITEEHFLLNKVVFSTDILQFIVNMSYCLVGTVTGSAEILDQCLSRNKLQREWSYNFPNYAFSNRHFNNSEKVSLYFSSDTLHGQPMSTWNFFLSTDLQSRWLSVCLQSRFHRKALWNGSV